MSFSQIFQTTFDQQQKYPEISFIFLYQFVKFTLDLSCAQEGQIFSYILQITKFSSIFFLFYDVFDKKLYQKGCLFLIQFQNSKILVILRSSWQEVIPANYQRFFFLGDIQFQLIKCQHYTEHRVHVKKIVKCFICQRKKIVFFVVSLSSLFQSIEIYSELVSIVFLQCQAKEIYSELVSIVFLQCFLVTLFQQYFIY
eukprot:TRINITY_DN857_c1_g2_i6.p1 TRINITY_DN857_c1_g2~~TRINITY_DN857_c1_g2_i6.p1  ORF type:complete len:198 (+),score=-18.32 TRINITY_DN857_c1_g2_i6:582-1175(+)